MNLSAFSSDSFDPKEWINASFQSPEAQANKEAYAAEVAFKLQLFIQEMNSALEETAQQVQQNLPKVLRDVETMQQESATLKQQMEAVQKDIEKVEHDSSKSMKTLLTIDTIKLRMLDANQALREADNWTTLSSDVDQVFQSGNVQAITSRLVGMQTSLEILVDVADYEERFQRLETLKNKLEAMLSPYLVQAFTTHSVDAAKNYVRVFSDIRRLPQLLKYYRNCQRSALLESWRKIVDSDTEDTFMEWLNNFYDVLLSTWHAQLSWCTQVFPEPPATSIVADVLVDVLSSLDPSLSFCLDASIKQQDAPTVYLADVVQTTTRLAKSLEMSISGIHHGDASSPHAVALLKTLYSFCRAHLEDYGSLEKKYLVSQLSSISFDGDSIADAVGSMTDSVPKAFALLREAEARCGALLHGCCYPQLVGAVEAFFRTYGERCRTVLDRLKSVPKQRSDGDGWPLFQYALRAMQTCGEILIQLGALERSLLYNVKSTLKQLRLQGGPPCNSGDGPSAERPSSCDHVGYVLTTGHRRELEDLAARLRLEESVVLSGSDATVRRLCAGFSNFAFDTVFSEIRSHLAGVANMSVWTQESPGGAIAKDLPAFSLSPLEYITQIGQYLLTIPQHIEPFVVEENEALATALKHGELPHAAEGADHVVDRFLGCVARATTDAYVGSVLRIDRLTAQASVQLATDVGYLCNVLDDLGLPPADSLQHLSALLRCSAQEFALASQGRPDRLVQAVRAMRGIRR